MRLLTVKNTFIMSFSSQNSTILTYIYYQGRNYQCFDLTDRTATSIETVRTIIATVLEIPALSTDDIVETKIDDDDYVVLNNYHLVNKSPWKSYSNAGQLLPSTKKVNLRIVSKISLESNTYPGKQIIKPISYIFFCFNF